jgi:ferrous iron transport protein A
MGKPNISLSNLPVNKKAKILSISGGDEFQRKLRVTGIREGKEIRIVSRQPFRGPLTVEVCGSQMTIGRDMAQKILVEVISH